ncbi:hypothetical protein BDW02DRAFT_474756, partial [Decorospora gaudefroyi]
MSQRTMMTRFVRDPPSTPSASGGRSVHHAAAARRLFAPPESPAPSPQATPMPSGISSQVSEALEVAEDRDSFVVDFHRLYYNNERLDPNRLGYGVKHKSQLAGKRKRKPSPIWRYGRCHQDRCEDAIKALNGYKHVVNHMAMRHRIDVETGLLPETANKPVYSSPFDAARVAGSNRLLSHTP